MKIGMITNRLGAPSFGELPGTAAELGIGKRRKLGVLQPWLAKP
jgi:hypothetical protein